MRNLIKIMTFTLPYDPISKLQHEISYLIVTYVNIKLKSTKMFYFTVIEVNLITINHYHAKKLTSVTSIIKTAASQEGLILKYSMKRHIE